MVERYKGDPYWMMTKYPGACSSCGEKISRGSRAFYFPKGRTLLGEACGCGEVAAQRFAAEAADEAAYNQGYGV